MCACDFDYVCAEHRGTPQDWRLAGFLPDPREDDIATAYAALSDRLPSEQSRDAA